MFDKCPRVPGLTKIDRSVRLLEATNVEIKENDKKKISFKINIGIE